MENIYIYIYIKQLAYGLRINNLKITFFFFFFFKSKSFLRSPSVHLNTLYEHSALHVVPPFMTNKATCLRSKNK